MRDTTSKPLLPELSVVVLCYRAGHFINGFVAQLEQELMQADIDYELVLVANYDKDTDDTTPQIVEAIAATNPRVRMVSKEKEGRMGWDMRSGLDAATGQHIAVIDGDGQMPVSDVVRVYNVLKEGQYDLVKTYRSTRHDGIYRKVISNTYNWLFKALFMPNFPLKDVNSKPKVMSRNAYVRFNLESSDWFTDAEIMIEAMRHKLKIGEISTVFYENEQRKSLVAFSTIFEFIKNLFYYRFFKTKK